MKFNPVCFIAVLSLPISMQAADFSTVPPRLEPIIEEEMREWEIGGIAVALIDDQKVLFAAGYGEAKRDSVFRVGSVSKLFNAVAVMQQVEAGKLHLDAPVPADVLPLNPYPDQPIVTLRQMLCHRSGLPREATIGGYLDGSEPGLEKTVASIRPSVLATRPGEKTRYSNLAPSIAGLLVARAAGESYSNYQRTHILDPLKMESSSWLLANVPKDRLVVSHMRIADGRGGWTRKDAPVFDLGTIPAGNLFSTVDDLAKFASALIAKGGGLLKPESLAEMWKPQLTKDDTGFGLGFMVGKFRDHKMISHNGAVYGHSTAFAILPDQKIGVVVIGNEDIVNGRIQHIANVALGMMADAYDGKNTARNDSPVQHPGDLSPFAGEFESQSFWARLEVRNERLIGEISGQAVRFVPTAPLQFTANSRLDNHVTVTFKRAEDGSISGFNMGTQTYSRVQPSPPPLPPEWRSYIGIYGPDFIPLIISERNGHLYAMTENMVDYRLTPVNRNTCLLPPGMYVDEHIVFLTDSTGSPRIINFAGMFLPRWK